MFFSVSLARPARKDILSVSQSFRAVAPRFEHHASAFSSGLWENRMIKLDDVPLLNLKWAPLIILSVGPLQSFDVVAWGFEIVLNSAEKSD